MIDNSHLHLQYRHKNLFIQVQFGHTILFLIFYILNFNYLHELDLKEYQNYESSKPKLPPASWSQWYMPENLHKGQKRNPGVPREPGVYRIRIADHLAYFGESANLARRIVGGWGGVNETDGRPSRNRTDIFRHLAKVSEELGSDCQISWASGSGPWPYDLSSKRERESLERCLGWLSRRATGRSPLGNYARASKGSQLVYQPIVDNQPQEIRPRGLAHPGTRALRSDDSDPEDKRWMGCPWTTLTREEDLDPWEAPGLSGLEESGFGPGLYKAFTSNRTLLFVGYGQNVVQSLKRVLGDLERRETHPIGSWSPLRRKVLKTEVLELIGDLIGALYHETGEMPKYQFRGIINS